MTLKPMINVMNFVCTQMTLDTLKMESNEVGRLKREFGNFHNLICSTSKHEFMRVMSYRNDMLIK